MIVFVPFLAFSPPDTHPPSAWLKCWYSHRVHAGQRRIVWHRRGISLGELYNFCPTPLGAPWHGAPRNRGDGDKPSAAFWFGDAPEASQFYLRFSGAPTAGSGSNLMLENESCLYGKV